MLLVKIGGPVYRIGVGGGAASSVAVQGGDSRDAALDFGAVQRGNYCATRSTFELSNPLGTVQVTRVTIFGIKV